MAIVEAAMELITSRGLAHTSMSMIAKAAGVSASTLYVYFENKEDMLNEIYLLIKSESSEALFEGFVEGMPFPDLFRRFLKNYYHYMSSHKDRFSFHEQFYNSPNISQEARIEGMKYYQPIVSLYEESVEAGILKTYPIELIAAFSTAPLDALINSSTLGELEISDEILDRAIEMAIEAVTV